MNQPAQSQEAHSSTPDVAALQRQIAHLSSELNMWKANHADQVSRNRILHERPDIPLERTKAYAQVVALEERCKALESLIAQHNESCMSSCSVQRYCRSYLIRDLKCPDCPEEWLIDLTGF